MIQTLVIEGGRYPDALASGVHAIQRDQDILTHAGTVPLPPGDPLAPLRLRITDVNGFQIAGEPHNSPGGAWHWTGSQWTRDLRVPHGVGGVIFDRSGQLHVLTNAGPGTPTGGYRYVTADNRIVTGDETQGSAALGLHEYTEYGDIALGQSSHSFGTVAVRDGVRYVVVAAHGPVGSRFPHFDRVSDACAVAVWCPSGASVDGRHYGPCAVIRWFNAADLAQFPVENVVVTPIPVPQPTPDPEPEPMPEQFIPESVKPAIRLLAERFADLRTGNDDARRAFALKVAEQVAFNLGPSYGTKRADPGRPPSKDALAKQADGRLFSWDIVNGDTRELQLDGPAEDITGQVFIPVQPFDHLAGDNGDPGDENDTPPPNDELRAEVIALRNRVRELELSDTLQDDLIQKLVEATNETRLRTLIAQAIEGLSVEGSTSRDWGHSHRIDLKVTR